MKNSDNPAYSSAYQIGLTKRELFAAIAMHGLIVCSFDCSYDEIIKSSAKYANDLLKELDKEID